MADEMLTRSFLETLLPLLRRVSAERGLSPGKLGALRFLSEQGRATTSELAFAERVSPQGMSLAVRELEGLGYVTRVPDGADRRRVWIEITEKGLEKLAQEFSAGYGWLDRAITQQLTPQERSVLEAVVPVLRKLGAEATDD